MMKKRKNVGLLWHTDEEAKFFVNLPDYFDYNDFDSLAKFTDTHPSVMQKKVAAKTWNVELDITKKKLSAKNSALYYIEKLTGIRLFDFKNYKIIK